MEGETGPHVGIQDRQERQAMLPLMIPLAKHPNSHRCPHPPPARLMAASRARSCSPQTLREQTKGNGADGQV